MKTTKGTIFQCPKCPCELQCMTGCPDTSCCGTPTCCCGEKMAKKDESKN